MNRDELRRSTKEAALACLRALGAAFAGEAEREAAVLTMINMVNDFDVKPPAPAVGFVVIGEEVGEQVVAAARQPPVTAASSDHERKRPRRQQPAENVQSRTLDDFPVGCEVLLPRTDDNGRRIGNDYCRVVSHTPDGQLRLEVPDDDHPGKHLLMIRSIFSLGAQLGSEEDRPLKRSSGGGGGSSGGGRSGGSGSSSGGGGSGSGGSSSSSSSGGCSGSSSGNGSGSGSGGMSSHGAPTSAQSGTTAVSKPPAAATAAVSGPSCRSKATQGFAPPVEDDRSAAEQMASSSLRLASGRTREQLNQHLSDLGLSAKFGQQVMSARDGLPSHLTFNIGDWNNLPATEQEPYIWWLGDGVERLRLARLIHPKREDQPAHGVPLFFAAKRSKGGALCHYGGHFAARHFVELSEGEKVHFKDRDRQARIEFEFDHFDEALAAAIRAIPDEVEQPEQ